MSLDFPNKANYRKRKLTIGRFTFEQVIEERRLAANGPAAERCTCHGENATSATNGIDDARNRVTRLQVSRRVDRALQFRRRNLRILGIDEKSIVKSANEDATRYP